MCTDENVLLCRIIATILCVYFTLTQDFTEAAVLKSIRCLTQCLIDSHNHGNKPPHGNITTSLEKESTVFENEPDRRQSGTERGFDHPAKEAVVADQTSRHSQPAEHNSPASSNIGKHSGKDVDRLETASKDECGLICDHPTTPVEISLEEPCFSKTSHPPHAVPLGKSASCNGVRNAWNVKSVGGACVTEMDVLNESTLESKKQLTSANEK